MIPTPRAQMTVRTAALVLLDVSALAAGWVFASNWRLGSYWGLDFRTTHQAQLAIHAGIFLIAGILFETYDPRRPYATAAELRKLLGGYLVAGLVELLIFFFRPEPLVGRGIFAINIAVFAGDRDRRPVRLQPGRHRLLQAPGAGRHLGRRRRAAARRAEARGVRGLPDSGLRRARRAT